MLRGVNKSSFKYLSSVSSRGGVRANPGAAMPGFTLLELMVVISIILILMSIAIPVYNQSVVRSKEAVLRQDLFTLRSVISQYTLDKQKAPQSLDDLMQAGYVKVISVDPMTRQADLETHQEDVLLSVDQPGTRNDHVHSASKANASH